MRDGPAGTRTFGSALATAALLASLVVATPDAARSQDLVFSPSVPGFSGGAAATQLNFQLAQAQKPESESDGFGRNPLESFQRRLQSQILGQISSQIVRSQFGEQVDLQEQGTFEVGNFIVDVVPGSGGVEVRVRNPVTGKSTTVTIPNI